MTIPPSCGGCGRVTGPAYTFDQCRLCWLRVYDPVHGGTATPEVVYHTPEVIAGHGRPVSVVVLEIQSCPFLGEAVNGINRSNEACGVKVRSCQEFGYCTTLVEVSLIRHGKKQVNADISCCRTCPKRPRIQLLGEAS